MIHTTAANGLSLVAEPHGPAPVVAVQLWFRTGSAWETPAEHGAAHLLEHMVFKGAGRFGVGDLTAAIEAVGGDLNAWTSFEHTALHATVPAARLDVALEVLGAMGGAPTLDAAELEREKAVVIEEIRGSADDPSQVLADAVRARAFGTHPYGRTILGTAESVGALDVAALRAFHDRFYTARNAVLAVAGPVDPDALRGAAGRFLPPGAARTPPRGIPTLPGRAVQPGAFALDPGFDERVVEVSFPIPGHDHPDAAALDLLAVGLGDGGGSVLSQVLRHDKDVVLSTWATLESEPSGGLLVTGFAARDGRTEDALRALSEVLRRVAREGIPAPVLRRARASVRADRLRERETVDGRANRLGWYTAAFGDPRREVAYEAAIQALTPADVARVARQYLRLDGAVIGAVAPAAELDDARAGAAVRAAPVTVAAGGPGAGERLHTAVLDNGIRVVMEPDPHAELVGVSVVGLGGNLAQGPRDAGLATAWSSAIARGAGPYDAVELSAVAEERAGSLHAWAARNTFGVRSSFPTADVRTAVDLVGLLLCAPTLSAAEVARTRADLLELQRSVKDDSAELAWAEAWAALYPGHAWGRPDAGTAASVPRVTPDRLRSFHRKQVQGRNLVVGVAGGFDPDEVVPLLARALGGIPVGHAVAPAPPVVPASFRRRRRRTVPRPDAPTSVVLAFPTVGALDPDDPVATVLAAVLGGVSGGAGRLFDHLREELGLAYSVGATYERGLGGGALLCSVEADPDRAREATRGLWAELDDLAENGIESDELEHVRAGIVEGSVLGLQRASARADLLAAAERYGAGAASWRERLALPGLVTGEQVARLARETLRRDRFVWSAAGPAR